VLDISGDPDMIVIRRATLAALFDVAVSSAGFMSDFWDDEETQAAVAVADVLGISRWFAIPDSHRRNFAHRWVKSARDSRIVLMRSNMCGFCEAPESHACHQPDADEPPAVDNMGTLIVGHTP
jgi:hypothetical protein